MKMKITDSKMHHYIGHINAQGKLLTVHSFNNQIRNKRRGELQSTRSHGIVRNEMDGDGMASAAVGTYTERRVYNEASEQKRRTL